MNGRSGYHFFTSRRIALAEEYREEILDSLAFFLNIKKMTLSFNQSSALLSMSFMTLHAP